MSDLLVADDEVEVEEEITQTRTPMMIRGDEDVSKRRLKKPKGLTGKPTVAMVERIEKKLGSPGGAMLKEMAADLQSRFGSYTEVEGPLILVDANKKKFRIGDSDKEAKGIRALRTEEIGKYIAVVEKYLHATYGEPFRNDHGKIIGLGDGSRIVVNERPGHYRRLY